MRLCFARTTWSGRYFGNIPALPYSIIRQNRTLDGGVACADYRKSLETFRNGPRWSLNVRARLVISDNRSDCVLMNRRGGNTKGKNIVWALADRIPQCWYTDYNWYTVIVWSIVLTIHYLKFSIKFYNGHSCMNYYRGIRVVRTE